MCSVVDGMTPYIDIINQKDVALEKGMWRVMIKKSHKSDLSICECGHVGSTSAWHFEKILQK